MPLCHCTHGSIEGFFTLAALAPASTARRSPESTADSRLQRAQGGQSCCCYTSGRALLYLHVENMHSERTVHSNSQSFKLRCGKEQHSGPHPGRLRSTRMLQKRQDYLQSKPHQEGEQSQMKRSGVLHSEASLLFGQACSHDPMTLPTSMSKVQNHVAGGS